MNYILLLLLLLFLLPGCLGSPLQPLAESESGYTYVPLDPFPVTPKPGTECGASDKLSRKSLLEALPDNAVRMLTERFDATGAVTYGSSKVGASGESYRVTIDYIYSDTMNKRVFVSKSVLPITFENVFWPLPLWRAIVGERHVVPINSRPSLNYLTGSEEYKVTRNPPFGPGLPGDEQKEVRAKFLSEYGEYNIPVYVGVGLRVSANIYSAKSNASISGLGVIGAEAEASNLKGSLIIQTLGVNGKSVAAALPIQSELNRTTAQNAIVAIGTIKALLHSEETWVSPRVVGLYLPFAGGKPLVNALISELSKEEISWEFTCFGRNAQSQDQLVPR